MDAAGEYWLFLHQSITKNFPRIFQRLLFSLSAKIFSVGHFAKSQRRKVNSIKQEIRLQTRRAE